MNAESVTTKAVIPIDEVLTHCKIHIDEIFAYWLLGSLGKNLFPGIEKWVIRFVDKNPSGDDTIYDADRVLPIGCGGGRFDEHITSGRKPGQCATTLVADYLDVRNRADLRPLIDEILVCDTKAGVHSLQMAEIIKAAHRCMPRGDRLTVKWAMMGLGWAYNQVKYSYARVNGTEPSAVSMMNRFLERHTVVEKIQVRLRMLCEQSDRQLDQVTGLGFVIMSMYRGRKLTIDQIYEWVESAFQWYVHDQEQFWQAVDEIRPGKPDDDRIARSKDGKTSVSYLIQATVGSETRRVQLLVVNSDNVRAHRASLWLKPDVLVLRHSDGHVQIFCHRQNGLDYDIVADIVAHLRYWEGGKDSGVTWEELRKPGNVSCSPKWYFFSEGLQILNGSETHSGVPPTTLTLDAVIQAVRRALYLPDLRKWQKELGIEIPEQKPKVRPLASIGEIAEANHHANGGNKGN